MKRTAMFLVLLLFLGGCRNRELKVVSAEPGKVAAGESSLVRLKGQGFREGAKVWVGSLECPQVLFISSSELIVLVPRKLNSGAQDIKVELPEGKSYTLAKGLTAETTVTVQSVNPASLPEGPGGVEVKIRGEGFQEGAKVWFGDKAAAVEVKSESLILARTPVLPVGTVDVKVENPDGSSGRLFDGFQVVDSAGGVALLPFKEESQKWLAGVDNPQELGLAIADVNQDGFLDCLVTGEKGVTLALGTSEGKFKDATAASGITFSGTRYGGFFGDFDQDGLPDLLLSGHPLILFHNLGNGRFENVSERVGLTSGIKGWAVCWLDFDADGLLDFFAGEPNNDDHLFHNEGGKFLEVSKEVMAKNAIAAKIGNRQPSTFSAAAADYDRDGWADLFVGIRGQPSVLLHNKQGRGFTNVSEAMGIALIAASNPTIYFLDWGVIWADFNQDGFLDLFSASGPLGGKMYRNREGKRFVDVSRQLQITFSQSPLAPAAGDFDNDGLLDLALADNLSALFIYRNQGDGSFREVTDELGIRRMVTGLMAVAWLDVNRDGALDLMVVDMLGGNQFYINTPYPGRHYLEVELSGTKSNSMGIGALVELQLGNTVMVRQVSGGESSLTQPPAVLHFGLGQRETVDKLTVIWPGGEKQILEGIKADQVLSVVQPGERKKVWLPPPLSAVQPEPSGKPQSTPPAPAAPHPPAPPSPAGTPPPPK